MKAISPNVSRDGDYRTAMNPPLAFSPQDPRVLYEGTQFLLQTSDAGVNWKAISPDLTNRPGEPHAEAKGRPSRKQARRGAKAKEAENKKAETREEEESVRPPDRSAHHHLFPSPVEEGQIWAGTNNGLVQLTRDGGKAGRMSRLPD